MKRIILSCSTKKYASNLLTVYFTINFQAIQSTDKRWLKGCYMESDFWLLPMLQKSFQTAVVSRSTTICLSRSVQDALSVSYCTLSESAQRDSLQSEANATTQYTDLTPIVPHSEYFANAPTSLPHRGRTSEMSYHYQS